MIEGILPPVITPFDSSENIEESKLTEFLDFVISKGVHGIFLLGTNGEGPLLTYEEKKRVIKIAADHVNGKVPVIAGTGSLSTKETIELSKYAEKVGVDAIHVVTPYYYPISQEGLLRHYERIAKSVEIPVIIYVIPSLTKTRMEVGTLLKLANIQNIIGIKDSTKDIGWFSTALMKIRANRPDFIFLCGSDALIYQYLTLGANGAVSAIANVFPELVVELYNEFKRGNHERAIELQKKVLAIRSIFKSYPYMAAIKASLKLRGYDFGELRLPLISLKKEDINNLREQLSQIGAI